MTRCSTLSTLAVASLLLVSITACQRGPAPIKQPSISASSAGKLAMEQYDTNSDGQVAGDELEKAPGLKAALANLDTNGDKAVTADEVSARVNVWQAMQTGMTYIQCRVTLDGQPLVGAQITFEPETFLGDEIKSAIGTTNSVGDAAPSIRPEDRP